MRALVIGLGVGAEHARAYAEEGLEVVVCDTDPAKLALSPYEKTADYRTEIRNCDIVSVCTPDDSHFLLATEALNHGKYVVIEKPPCLTMDEMEHLKRFDDHLYCNLPLPFHFKDLINECEDPYLIECEYNWGRHRKFTETWRKDGYNIILGAGLHMFDLMLCFKPDGLEDGACLGANKSGVNADYDCVQAIMRWKDGTMGRVGIDCGFDGAHGHRVVVCDRGGRRVVENTASVDKTPGIRDFVDRINRGKEIENSRLWNALTLCFQLGDVA